MFGNKNFLKAKFNKAEVDVEFYLAEGEAEMNSRKEVKLGSAKRSRIGLLSFLTFSILMFALKSSVALAEVGSPDLEFFSISDKVKLEPRHEGDAEREVWDFKNLENPITVPGMVFRFGNNPRAMMEWTALAMSEAKDSKAVEALGSKMVKAFEKADVSEFKSEDVKKAWVELIKKAFDSAKKRPELVKDLKSRDKMKAFLTALFDFKDEKTKELLAKLDVTNEDLLAKEKEEKERKEKERQASTATTPSTPVVPPTAGPAVGAAAGAAATAEKTETKPAPAATVGTGGVPGTEAVSPKTGEQPSQAAANPSVGACPQVAQDNQRKQALQREADAINGLFAEVRQVAAAQAANNNGNNRNQNNDFKAALGPLLAQLQQNDRRNRDNNLAANNTPTPFVPNSNNNGNNREQNLASPVPDNNLANNQNQGSPITASIGAPNIGIPPYQPSNAPLPELGNSQQLINNAAGIAMLTKQNADGSRIMNLSDNATPREVYAALREAKGDLNSIDTQVAALKTKQDALTNDLQLAKEYTSAQDQQKEQQLTQALQQAQQAGGGLPQQGAQLAIQQVQQQAAAQGRQATQEELQNAAQQGQQAYGPAGQQMVQQAQANLAAFKAEQAARNPKLKSIQQAIDNLGTQMAALTAQRKPVKDEVDELTSRYQEARDNRRNQMAMAYGGGRQGNGRPNVNNAGNVNQSMGQWTQNAPQRPTSLGSAMSGQRRGPLSGQNLAPSSAASSAQ